MRKFINNNNNNSGNNQRNNNNNNNIRRFRMQSRNRRKFGLIHQIHQIRILKKKNTQIVNKQIKRKLEKKTRCKEKRMSERDSATSDKSENFDERKKI